MATVIHKNSMSTSSARETVRPVAFNFEDMNDRASDYLETVRREAAKIVQQAHQQAETIRRQAEYAGRAAAEDAAQRAVDEKIGKQLGTLMPAIEQFIVELNEAKAEWLRHWENAALSVATEIAHRVIRRELAQRPEIALDWISEALRLATGGPDITLRLNPADHESLGAQVECIGQALCQLAPTDIVADPAVTPGGCIVNTRFGQIDQQIEAQLARLQEELK